MNANFSRRAFTRALGTGVAYAAFKPTFAEAPLRLFKSTPGGSVIVRLSSNENPYGPSPLALKAMTDAFALAWRYPDEHEQSLIDALATFHGVNANQILIGNGSGEILKVAAAAFTGPAKKMFVASPTFEAIARHARIAQANVVEVRLTEKYAHDLAKMSASDAGLVYVCNPNNPTASITPKDQLRNFLNNTAKETVVLVDEAYHHYVDTPDYESVIPLVRQYPNLIVARTFSKVFAMAGLRCGYCVARPDLIQMMKSQQTWDSVNIMALVAATASLKDADQVTGGRRRNAEVKKYVYSEFDRMGLDYIPSHANFMMVNLRHEVRPLIQEMRERNVEVGRFFPPLPNFMRVTIGTQPQMETFVSTLRSVMS